MRSNSPSGIGELWRTRSRRHRLQAQPASVALRIVAPLPRSYNRRPPSPPGSDMSSYEAKRAELRRAALEYHEFPTPGKVAIAPTKQLINQRDLALAYSPGVAAACEEIAADPVNAHRFTARGNLVAVVTHG